MAIDRAVAKNTILIPGIEPAPELRSWSIPDEDYAWKQNNTYLSFFRILHQILRKAQILSKEH